MKQMTSKILSLVLALFLLESASAQSNIANPRSFFYLQGTPVIPNASYLTTVATDSFGQTLASYNLPDGKVHYLLMGGASSQDLVIPQQLLDANGLHGTSVKLTGLNELGQFVGYSDNLVSLGPGLMWSGLTLLRLQYPGAYTTMPRSINLRGQIAGDVTYTNQLDHGFVLDPIRGFSRVSAPGGRQISTKVFAINSLGDLAGTYLNMGNYQDRGAFIMTHTNKVFYIDASRVYDERGHLTPLVAELVVPRGMNSSGEIVGTFYSGLSGVKSFYYYAGVFEVLDPGTQIPGIGNSSGITVSGIADKGEIFGWASGKDKNIIFTGIAPSRPPTPWYETCRQRRRRRGRRHEAARCLRVTYCIPTNR